MQIEWKSDAVSPYLFRQVAEWPGLRIHRAHVLPGRMLEHTNDLHEVNVAISGSLTTEKISNSGRRIRTVGGDGNFCITPAGQSLSARWDKPLQNLGMFFQTGFVSSVAAENGFPPDFEFVEVYKSDDPLVQNIGLSLLESAATEEPLGKLYEDSLIQTLTLHLLSKYTTAGPRPVPAQGGLSGFRLRRVIEFVEANLDSDISLADLADVAGLSQFHFARAFRTSTGKTPQQFVMQHRLERAKELLQRPELPLVEVSLRSGFKSQSHFTTLFRKYTSFTPKLWRELKLA